MKNKIMGILLLFVGGLFSIGALLVMVDNVYLAIVYDVSYLGGTLGGLLVLIVGYFTMKSGYERVKHQESPELDQ